MDGGRPLNLRVYWFLDSMARGLPPFSLVHTNADIQYESGVERVLPQDLALQRRD